VRTFTRRDGTRQLFCTVELSDGILAVTEGEIGTDGVRRSRAFPTAEQAQEEHDNLIAQRRAEGYR
jgi:predicted DNA-binding WGR domain protein